MRQIGIMVNHQKLLFVVSLPFWVSGESEGTCTIMQVQEGKGEEGRDRREGIKTMEDYATSPKLKKRSKSNINKKKVYSI